MIDKMLKKYKLWSIIIAGVNLQLSVLLIIALAVFFSMFHYISGGFAIAAFLMVIVLTVFSLLLLFSSAELKEQTEEAEKSRMQTARRIEAIRKHIAG